ncbi:MAG TPA: D-glycerate dehydrogenase [Candidatus Polarisedimenticolia bacterium]|nr:D-glycerate dehydrogenase [Candidatus Polarisedimenticolia bacterium]
MKIPVLLTRRLFPEAERILSRRCRLVRRLAEARGAVGAVVQLTDRIDARFFDRLPALRVVSQCAVGVDNIDLEEAGRRGVAIMNTPGVLTEATAEMTWALILAAARRVVEGDRVCRRGAFPGWDLEYMLGTGLWGGTLGVVGMGRIGCAVARRAPAFGMKVLYVNRTGRRPGEAPPGARRASLGRLLAASDVVTLHVPASAGTRHMIGRREISSMKRGAILVNTARGSAVDQQALVAALRSGHLAGAGLDVFEREPWIPGSLRRLPRVVLTPHVASATRRTRGAMAETAARNVVAFLEGRPPADRTVVPGGRAGLNPGRAGAASAGGPAGRRA